MSLHVLKVTVVLCQAQMDLNVMYFDGNHYTGWVFFYMNQPAQDSMLLVIKTVTPLSP
jgi:hypothetical protein